MPAAGVDKLRVAVLGAGMTGLAAAHRLAVNGHVCDVYERWPGLGGQVATLDVGGRDPLERYYHHLFTTDREIAALYEELGVGDAIEWRRSSVAIHTVDGTHPFTTPLDLLRFTPLRLRTRIRMGLAVLRLQRERGGVGPYEGRTARDWIESEVGSDAWAVVWGPLLRGKFGDRADAISMAWLWSKLTLRRRIHGSEAKRELLGYPRGGWQPLLERLAGEIVARGGRVLEDHPAQRIARDGDGFAVVGGARDSFRRGHDPRSFEGEGPAERYDAVLGTVPNDVFEELLDDELRAAVGDEYLGRLRSIEYHAAVCLLLELDRPFGDYYWTNVADPALPFVGLIEHTNLVEAGRYGGSHYLYVANYVAAGDELLELDAEALLDLYEPGLRRVNPGFSREWLRRSWLHREPAAQPIVTVGYRERIPALETGVPGLLLANTTQIYPQDRGTNYSVRLGTEAAAAVEGQARRGAELAAAR